MRDSRYNVLFEPLWIDPLIAKNRFYQIPHFNAVRVPFSHTQAAMRGLKAEGDWVVVNTEWRSVHPLSDTTPDFSARLRADEVARTNALVTKAAHHYDALAGCHLVYANLYAPNRYLRIGAKHVADIFNEPEIKHAVNHGSFTAAGLSSRISGGGSH